MSTADVPDDVEQQFHQDGMYADDLAEHYDISRGEALDWVRSVDDRLALERKRELASHHQSVPETICEAVAYCELGYSSSGMAKRMDVTEGTAKKYLDRIGETFGIQACFSKPPEAREGPLDETTDRTAINDNDELPDMQGDDRVVPESMLRREQWVCYKGKEPRAPWAEDTSTDQPVSAKDESNWTDYATARKWAEHMPGWGVGFSFAADGPFVGIDLDDCRDPETGELTELAQDIIDRAESFTAVSKSGTGVHVYAEGTLSASLKNEERGVELYDRERYFAFTGDHLSGPVATPERQALVDDLSEEYAREDVYELPERDGDYDPQSPFEELAVVELYPQIRPGDRVAHPIHDSSTGSNFRLADDGHTATCWRGEHQLGSGDGCGLNAQILLAMEALDLEHCAEARNRYGKQDYMVFAAFKEAVDRGLCEATPPPHRAVLHIDDSDLGMGDILGGGAEAAVAYRHACRMMRTAHDIPVEPEEVPAVKIPGEEA